MKIEMHMFRMGRYKLRALLKTKLIWKPEMPSLKLRDEADNE